jgi:hypothetical protein
VCEQCRSAMDRPNAVIEHPSADETQWVWLDLADQILHNTFTISGYRNRQPRAVEVLHGDLPDWHLPSLTTHRRAGHRSADEQGGAPFEGPGLTQGRRSALT